jgi:hypothetical protein
MLLNVECLHAQQYSTLQQTPCCCSWSTHPFACAERQVLVLDHVLDLPLHGDSEEQQPIQEQNGPEHWNIEHGEQRHCHADADGLYRRPPAAEAGGQASHSWYRFLVTAAVDQLLRVAASD